MANGIYKITEDFEKALQAEDIADVAWYAANVPAHVCINDVVLTCVAQANSMYLHKP